MDGAVLASTKLAPGNDTGGRTLYPLTPCGDDSARCNASFLSVIDALTIGICLFDSSGNVVLLNKAYAKLYNLPLSAIDPGDATHSSLSDRAACGTWAAPCSIDHFDCALQPLQTETGQILELHDGRSILIQRRPIAAGGWVTVHEDITDRRQNEARILHLALHDALTGLANRILLCQRLDEGLKRFRRNDGMALLSLDLDGFKSINDTFGHAAGDALLCEVAARLKATVRELDTVARLGGDEFAIVQVSADGPDKAVKLAERVLEAVSRPYNISGRTVNVGCSIGIALADDSIAGPDELLRRSDFALYRAKSEGRGILRFFESAMNKMMIARHELERDLRSGLVKGQFELVYQPIVDLTRRSVTSFEALVRWKHPKRGCISPADFIPIAEETGLIIPLGEGIMHQALQDAAHWPNEIGVAVNVSVAQLRSDGFAEMLERELVKSSVDPKRLHIEVTESLLIGDTQSVQKVLRRIKRLGVRLSMDDFGIGYSSLNSLRNFPFDKLKIDKSFVKSLGEDDKSVAVLRAIVTLGRSLGIATTAEGVETEDQLRMVIDQGCNECQGYLFCPPRPVAKVHEMVRECENTAKRLTVYPSASAA